MANATGRSPWDVYAEFYDWENARTLGRRDVAFWRRLLERERTPTLELGCGTGRLLSPLARTGTPLVGIDWSAPMLARARVRLRRIRRALRPQLTRGDIRRLPFGRAAFGMVMASYGMLQSLLSDADLDAALAESRRVLARGGLLGVDLVPDLPAWQEYRRQVRLRGRSAARGRITLVETARQDRRRRLTIFDEEFVERRGRTVRRRRFSLTFRTLPLHQITARLKRHGFRIESTSGSYRGRPLDDGADVWLVLARRR
jgi:ubiquinone/menaquinone biosynthesis C-methylase UbiE